VGIVVVLFAITIALGLSARREYARAQRQGA
jgi:hypothetical protein